MFFKKPESERAVTFADFEHGVDCPCCTRNSRRTFIKTAAIVTAGLLAPVDWARAATRRERMIKMFNPHTGESIRAVFWTPEYGYIQPAMDEISNFFRDFRQNQIVTVDIDLLNILHYMQSNVGKQSYHMKAQAADISIQGYTSRQLRAMAQRLNAGGIGLYRGSNFIHVDSGPIRTWYY